MVTLVLLPGLDGTGQLFDEFVAALGPEVKTIVVSYPSEASLGYAELEAFTRSFLPRNQPFYLLAESFSGPIAISIAASSPPGLLGLVLCCSFARNPLPLLALFRPAVRVAPVSILPMAWLSFFVLGRFASSSLHGVLAKSLALVSPSVLRARACAALSVNVSVLLPRIKVSVLYLRASEDRIVYPSSSALVASLAQNVTVTEFVAPHFLLQVLPYQAAVSVLAFMGIGGQCD
jgi:pimeloyl-ACP methyl ester carboxylesterase